MFIILEKNYYIRTNSILEEVVWTVANLKNYKDLMINWGDFDLFFSTGIPSVVLYLSLVVVFIVIAIIFYRNYKHKRSLSGNLRPLLWLALAEYIFIVVCSTIICRGMPSYEFTRIELTPFWTYSAVIKQIPGVSVWDIVLNVVLFLPFGFLIKLLYPRMGLCKLIVAAVFFSVFIETSQYVFEKGITQIDDVIHNTMGASMGWLIAKLMIQSFIGFRALSIRKKHKII